MAHSRAVSVPLPAGASRIAHSRAVSVLYLLEPVGWLILVLLVSPYLLEPVGWLVLELLVSLTCWSQ